MNLEDIISSDISQAQKDKYWVIHFCELFRVVRVMDWSGGWDEAWGIWESEMASYCFMEREFQLRERKILRLVLQECEGHLRHCLYT